MKSILFYPLCFLVYHNLIAQSEVFIATDSAKVDIEQLVTTFERVHYNPYFKTTKEEFNLVKEQIVNAWNKDSITMKNFMVSGMKLTAMLSGGHSYMDWQNPLIIPELSVFNFIPFTGKINSDNQFIVTKSDNSEIKIGQKVKSINGISIVDLFKECMSYIGGINSFKNANCEKVFPLYLFFNDELKAPYAIETGDAHAIIKSDGMDINNLISFVNSEQPQVDYTFKILENNIGLIAYNSCNNYKKFKKFLKKTFQVIKDNNINKLIIDIRENGGGDASLNDLLLAYITKNSYRQSSGRYWKVSQEAKNAYSANKVYDKIFGKDFMSKYMNTPNQEIIESLDGEDDELISPISPKNYFNGTSCILIGPNTFSSANFLADAVKTYDLTTLIGTSTGEYTNDFGEQLSFDLQNSGSTIYVSSTLDVAANGDNSILEPVHPDVEVQGDALEYAINWMKKDANKE